MKKRSKSKAAAPATASVVTQVLGDKNNRTKQAKKKTKIAKSHATRCFGVRVSERKITAAIENDDERLMAQLISANEDVLDHVDENGRTLLHLCVDNTWKFGSLYSRVGKYLISQGCSLKARDQDGKTVAQDAYEKEQYLLLKEMIGAYIDTETQQGRMLPIQCMLPPVNEAENRTVIGNFALHKLGLETGSQKWSMIGKGCEAYLTAGPDGEPNLNVINEKHQGCLQTTHNAIRQLVVRKGVRVVMQVASEGSEDEAEEKQCYLFNFKKDLDAFYFASFFKGAEQGRKDAEANST